MPVDERYRRQVELLARTLRKLAQLDERERSAMVRRVEAARTDKIDSIHHRARYFVPSVRARASW